MESSLFIRFSIITTLNKYHRHSTTNVVEMEQIWELSQKVYTLKAMLPFQTHAIKNDIDECVRIPTNGG